MKPSRDTNDPKIPSDQPHSGSLEITGLTVRYGKVEAVRGITLSVAPGEVVGFLGPNSAGKSSTLRSVLGARRATVSGEVRLGEQRLNGMSTTQRMKCGLRLVPEGRQLFPTLTVEENLRVVADSLQIEWKSALDLAKDLFPEVFVTMPTSIAGNLSGGQQQMVALSRAIIGSPQVLMLDEPALGLAVGVTRRFAEVIRTLADSGVAVLLADQSMHLWEGLLDRSIVLIRGEIVATVANQSELLSLLGHD